jgi:hypothetical protein
MNDRKKFSIIGILARYDKIKNRNTSYKGHPMNKSSNNNYSLWYLKQRWFQERTVFQQHYAECMQLENISDGVLFPLPPSDQPESYRALESPKGEKPMRKSNYPQPPVESQKGKTLPKVPRRRKPMARGSVPQLLVESKKSNPFRGLREFIKRLGAHLPPLLEALAKIMLATATFVLLSAHLFHLVTQLLQYIA